MDTTVHRHPDKPKPQSPDELHEIDAELDDLMAEVDKARQEEATKK